MGFFLLWLEDLGLSLLLVATLLACIARWKRSRVTLALGAVVMVVPLLIYAGLTCVVATLELGPNGIKMGLFYPLLALTLGYCIGVIGLRWNAYRRTEEDSSIVAATHWPRGKLAIALMATFCLHVLTVMNMDAAVQQRMVAVRTEASALALSVAPERVPDRDNAALVYNEAFEAMGPAEEWSRQWGKLFENFDKHEEDVDWNQPEVVKFLDAQAGVLIILREAAGKPACAFDRDYGRPSINIMLPELQRIRSATLLVAADARRKAAAGEGRRAIDDVQVMFHQSRHFSEEPFLVGLLVAISLDSRACATLETVLNASPRSTEELEGIEIDASFNYRRLLDRAMKMEEALGMWTLANVGGQLPLHELVGMMGNQSPTMTPLMPRFGIDTFYRVVLLGDDLDAYRRIMYMYRPRFMENYKQSLEQWQDVEKDLKTKRAGVLAYLIIPALVSCQQAVTTADARRRLAQVGLALHRYRAKHKRFPEKLDELTTDFLPVVPRDPFDGQPLRFKPTKTGWVVYSIGRDLIDQGGVRSDEQNKGDVVFEIRTEKAE